MDYLFHPFGSKRHTVFAKKGIVAARLIFKIGEVLGVVKLLGETLKREYYRVEPKLVRMEP